MSTKIELQNIADTAITAISALGAPKITQIGYPGNDTAADTAGGQTITLTGTGFQSGLNILVGSVSASVVTFISSTQVTFVTPSTAAGTYVMYVINPDGGTGISIPGISYSGTPAWTTPAGSLGSATETTAIASTVAATSDSPVTYTVASGTVPPGSTLNSNTGLLSGTAPASAGATTYSFVIRATDAQNQDTDRSFSLTVNTDVVTWSNPAQGATVALTQDTAMSNISLSAVSAAGAAVTYTANTLPAGVTLTGNVISGTPTVASTVTTALTATAATTRSAVNVISWTVSVGGDTLFAQNTLLLSGSATTFVRDASTNNLAVTVFGDTRPNTFNPYLTGWSNFFDGTGDRLTSPTAFELATNGNWTIEAFVNPSSISTSTRYILGLGRDTGGTTPYLQISTDASGRLNADESSTVTQIWTISTTQVLPAGAFSHIALVQEGSAIRLYFNGILIGSTTFSTAHVTGMRPWIGEILFGSGEARTNGFIGHISNVRFVNGVSVYTGTSTTTANFVVPTAPLAAIAGTALLTCQSNRFRDASTNNVAITRTGDVTVDSFSPFVEPVTTNGSGFFDGNGDYITAPSNAALQLTGDFTVEAWIYPTAINNFNMVFGSDNGQSSDYLTIRASTIELAVSNTAYPAWTQTFVANRWYHIAVTRQSNTLRAFVDGVQLTLSGGSATNSSQYFQSGAGVSIGRYGFTSTPHHFTGYISNARIVKGTALYTTAFTPPTSPLTAVANTSLLTLQNNQPTNNSMFLDSSTENFVITRNGNATQGTFSPYSPSGWSNYFSSASSALTVADNAAWDMDTDYSIEAFCYLTSYNTSDQYYIVSQQADPGQRAWGFALANGKLQIYYSSNGTAQEFFIYSNSFTVTANQWYHFAVTRTSAGVYTFYVNGVATGTTTNTASIFKSNQPLTIGQFGNFGISTLRWDGYISNLRILRGAIAYSTNFTPSTTPLTAVAGTVLLTCMDNRFIDDSVNNFALTRFGDVRTTNFSPFRAQTQVPTTYSAYFDGTGDYLTAPVNDAFNFGTGDFTIEFWFNTPSLASVRNFINNYNGAGTAGWGIQWRSDTTRYNFFFGDTSILTFSSTPALNTWTHVAVSRSGTTLRMFVNGVLVANTTNSTNLTSTRGPAIGDLFADGQGYVFPYSGYISNVRVVKGTAVYTANFTPSTTPLTAVANTSLLTCQSPTFVDNSTNRFAITAFGNSQPTMVNPFGSTFTNTSGYSAVDHGGSIYFNANSAYVLAAMGGTDSFGTGDFTVELWLYPLNSAINLSFPSSNTNSWGILTFNNQLYWQENGGNLGGVGYGSIQQASWSHIAVSRSGSTIRFFVNGVQVSSLSNTFNYSGAPTNRSIGPRDGGGVPGYISNFRIVRGTALYASSFVPPLAPVQPVPNTVLLVNGTSAAIADATTKNVVETVGDARISTAVSKFGGSSMSFDGTGDFLTTTMPALGTGSFTVEFWFYPTDPTRAYLILDKGFRDGNFSLQTDYLNTGMFYLNVGGTGYNISFTPPIANQWNHIAISRNSSSLRFFLNGVQLGTTQTNSGSVTTGTLYIGGASTTGSGYLTTMGYIQDLRITQGAARYTANFTPPATAFFTS